MATSKWALIAIAAAAGSRRWIARATARWIDREEQADVAQMLVELLAPHAGLDGAVEILGIDRQDHVHLRHVDADPAAHRGDIALDRGAGAEGDDRHLRLDAEPDDLDHLLGAARKGDRVRQHCGEMGLAAAVLKPHRLAEVKPVADDAAQLPGESVGQRPGRRCRGRAHGQKLNRMRAP